MGVQFHYILPYLVHIVISFLVKIGIIIGKKEVGVHSPEAKVSSNTYLQTKFLVNRLVIMYQSTSMIDYVLRFWREKWHDE